MWYKGDKMKIEDILPHDIDIGKFAIIQASFSKKVKLERTKNLILCRSK